MQLTTILRQIERYKGFVYEEACWADQGRAIEVKVRARKNSRGVCSKCGTPGPIYDRLRTRRYVYIPLWIFAVFLVYRPRRITCPNHGFVVEQVPWAQGKSPLCSRFAHFLARWARRLSWKEVAELFEVGWGQVRNAVKQVVDYGLVHRSLVGTSALGIDELHWGVGHRYVTLVYEIAKDSRRLLYVGAGRTGKSLLRFFHDQGRDWCGQIQFVCTDMWKPYLKVVAKKLPQALNILDRFHIVKKLGEALNQVRAEEARELKREGNAEILKHTKYCFLKRPENLTPKQGLRLRDVLRHRLKSVRAYRLKESFEFFWSYVYPAWAAWYLRQWCNRAMRSRLEPFQKFVRTLRRHEDLMLNWFKAKKEYSSGVIEGLNRKADFAIRKACGFRCFATLQLALLHNLGALPEPEFTHRFY